MHAYDVDAVVECYLEAAFWADLNDDDGEPVRGKSFLDIAPESMVFVTSLVSRFLNEAATLLASTELTEGEIGHSLRLNAGGHGTGFWDCGLGATGDALSALCRGYDAHVELGDDGLVYFC